MAMNPPQIDIPLENGSNCSVDKVLRRVQVPAEDQTTLERWLRSRTAPQRQVERAQMMKSLSYSPTENHKKHRNRKLNWQNNVRRIICLEKEGNTMSDLQAYISERKKTDPEFAEGYEEGFRNFKIGVLLKQARENAGLTQDEVAQQLNTKKTAVSRIENHAEDIRLSTLEKYAKAFGKKLRVELVD